MKHVEQESLVQYALGESHERTAIEQHLALCETCQAELQLLQELLAASAEFPVPEPDAGFEARIWARQRAALRTADAGARVAVTSGGGAAPADAAHILRPAFWSLRRLSLAGAAAAALVLAFLAGLYTPPPGTADIVPGEPRDRVLLVAVGDHLERTRMVLLELSNDDAVQGVSDARLASARALLGDNRLYRQTATMSGQGAVAEVLEEVERVLLELARSPGTMTAEEVAWLRERIADRDLLFKVSVIETQVRGQRPRRPGDL